MGAPKNANQKMLGDFYASGLAVAAADAKGLEPVAGIAGPPRRADRS